MQIPAWFSTQLAVESDGRLRVRWSEKTHRFQVESRSGRAIIPSRPISPLDDEAIRARDGFNLVLEVTPGDHTDCPKCGEEVRLIPRRIGDIRCPRCSASFRACFFPLSEDLLLYLRYSDPDRGGIERVFRDADLETERLEARMRRERHNRTEDIWKDDWNKVVGIPSVGYAGRRPALPAGR